MTDLTIEPKWNASINRLERNEFATGGADGNMNIAPRQLAENVFWLKDDIDGKITAINESNIAQDAAINDKASAADVAAKNDLQDAAINQNTIDIGGLLVAVSEHTTAIIDLDDRATAIEGDITVLTANGKDQNTGSVLKFWTGTQLEYEAVGTKTPTTIYLVTE